MSTEERRRAPRVPTRLDLQLRLPDGECAVLGQTLNLSRNGVYFSSSYFMSEGTKLPLRLELPAAAGAPSRVQPEGIVVRCQPDSEDPDRDHYEVACFFVELDPADEERLQDWISARLKAAEAS